MTCGCALACGAYLQVQDVALLLEALDAEVAGQRNWDFCQALIKHVLEVSRGGRWAGEEAGRWANMLE